MRRLSIAGLLLLLFLSVRGQDNTIDSLKAVLRTVQTDSARVATLLDLSAQYYRTDAEEARRLAQEAKEKAEAEAAEKEKAEAAAEEEGGRKGKHRRGSRDKGEAREDKGEKTETASKPTGAKGTLTVLVRPWAVVFIDGKRIKQTPLRDYSLSAGKHTVLLVNENKGKRESITVDAKASANTSINRTWE